MSKIDNLFSDLLEEKPTEIKLAQTEKLLRHLDNLCGRMFLIIRIKKYPIVFDIPVWQIIISKSGKDREIALFKKDGMDYKTLLKDTIKWVEKYTQDRKDYNIYKGGSEFI